MTENIIEKVKKALALGNDPGATEGERMNALAMASAMMQKHAIDQSALIDKPGVLLKQVKVEDADEQWHSWLASATGMINTVKPVNYGAGTFAFIGRPDQVEGAAVMFPWLIDQIERLYKRDLPKGLSKAERANFRRTFKQACAARVWARANDIIEQMRTSDVVARQATGSRALVVVASIDAQLGEIKDWMKDNGFQVKETKSKVKLKPTLGALMGSRAGHEVKLNNQISGSYRQLEHKK